MWPERPMEEIAVKKLALFAVMLLASGPVFAQTAPPPPVTSSPHKAAPKAADGTSLELRVDKRITRLHQQLKITPDQETAWTAFAQVMRDNVTSIDKAYKDRSASLETMSAPDNMRNFAQIEQARADGVQKLATSFQTLYDALSDSQKKTADTLFRHYGDHGAARKHAPK